MSGLRPAEPIAVSRVVSFRLRRSGAASVFLAAALVASVTACSGGDDSVSSGDPGVGDGDVAVTTGEGSGPVSGDPEVVAARQAIDQIDLADPVSLEAVDAIVFTDASVLAAAAALDEGVSGGALWAATYLYASGGSDPAVLEPFLEDPDPTVRAMAAAAVLSWGSASGAAVLVDLIADDRFMAGAHPPRTLSAFALATLARFIAGPDVPDGTESGAAADLWRSWLEEHGGRLAFHDGRWSLP